MGGLAFVVVILAIGGIAHDIIDPSAAEVEGGFWHDFLFALVQNAGNNRIWEVGGGAEGAGPIPLQDGDVVACS